MAAYNRNFAALTLVAIGLLSMLSMSTAMAQDPLETIGRILNN